MDLFILCVLFPLLYMKCCQVFCWTLLFPPWYALISDNCFVWLITLVRFIGIVTCLNVNYFSGRLRHWRSLLGLSFAVGLYSA